jgi:hypothetical protein
MFGEEGEGALLGEAGVGGAVAGAVAATEAVLGAGVDEHVDRWLRGFDRVHVTEGDAAVFLAEMQLHRAMRDLRAGAGDAAAVPANGGLELAGAGGAPPCDGAPPAIADDAEETLRDNIAEAATMFVPKPYSLKDLAAQLEALLPARRSVVPSAAVR